VGRYRIRYALAVSLIADIRKHSGLTQHELARRAGTSRTRLSAYERGRTAPELGTVERLARAAQVELGLVPKGTNLLRAQLEMVREAVGQDQASPAVRLVAEVVAWVRDGVIDIDALRAEPDPLGDRRWDALLAGVVELLCAERHHRVPGWTASPWRVLDGPWFVSRLRTLWPEILVTTPAPLAARGVLLSARSLESV
jgi:transcriptional regulator with XRE-family HTH domain